MRHSRRCSKTRNNKMSLLRQAIELAIADDVLLHDPAAGIDSRAVPAHVWKWIDGGQNAAGDGQVGGLIQEPAALRRSS